MTGEIFGPNSEVLIPLFSSLVITGIGIFYFGETQVRRNADRIVYNINKRIEGETRQESIARYGLGFSEDPRLGLYSF